MSATKEKKEGIVAKALDGQRYPSLAEVGFACRLEGGGLWRMRRRKRKFSVNAEVLDPFRAVAQKRNERKKKKKKKKKKFVFFLNHRGDSIL